MTLSRRAAFVMPLALLIGPPANAATTTRRRKATAGNGSWDGRWVGAWNGSQPTAQIVIGDKVVAYEFGGQPHLVAASVVTPTKIVYGDDVVVTITRTGANTAHATIKASQGEATAELTRK
jgi:hypothetical protein